MIRSHLSSLLKQLIGLVRRRTSRKERSIALIVHIAAPSRFAGLVAQYGVSFAPLPGDPEELIVHINNLRHNPPGAAWSLARNGYSTALPVIRAVCADADLIIHFLFLTTVAHSLARAVASPMLRCRYFRFSRRHALLP